MSDTSTSNVRIGTRESQLARLQTDAVIAHLQKAFPDLKIDIHAVSTRGDKVLNKPLAELGGRGVFVKELEEALLANEVDLVVHSLKDLPTDMPSGLTLAAVLDRDDPRDVLVSRNHVSFKDLPSGAKVATSSRRRAAQLRAIRNDLEFIDIRGNLPTRLRKQDEGLCDAMILAAAGLLRLGLSERITEYLNTSISTPAVGQAALGVQCRAGDKRIIDLLHAIDDQTVRAEVTAERAFLNELGGGCSVPIGALCSMSADGMLTISGCVASLDGVRILRATQTARQDQAESLGKLLAEQMRGMGAGEILDALKQSVPNIPSPP